MRISDTIILKLLESSKTADAEKLAALKQEGERSNRPLQQLVIDEKVINEAALTKLYAEYADIPYVELDPKMIDPGALQKIPERIARQYSCIVFEIDKSDMVHLAMDDPDDVQALNFLKKEVGENVRVYIAPRENIMVALENYRGDVNQELNEVIDIQREDDGAAQQVSESEFAEDSPIAQTVNLLLEYAIKSQASDIHIEPREEHVQIRYRIDGVLHEVNRLPRSVLGALVSRIKILSNLKIDERRVPQDGRFKIKVAAKQYALRVSTLPIADGEKVVMRILDESNQALTLQDLGYWGHSLSVVESAMHEPNGMILVTGPTGSGKSTSLFSILTLLNKPEINISTVEDPVEYKIPGVNQTQVNPKAGMTFANGLRALLRQDPNIIMVGEIRDSETANLGVQAALTGHLVLSTLHTNNAATCLPRLLDMNIEPFLIASTVKAIIGQRLVRRLCPACRERYTPTEAEAVEAASLFNLGATSSQSRIHEFESAAAAQGIGGDAPLSTDKTGIKALWKAHEGGCDSCSHSGYKGRMGIYEALGNSIPVQKLIMASGTSSQIQDQAISEGMTTMQSDGTMKALRGVTTIAEVLRVTRE